MSISKTRLQQEVNRRRTFAIISHPDAGKTTLTEKLLLFGGAIQTAGMVKARGERRRARSDWLDVERERGISVTASVMTFSYDGCAFNLLDTPGHEDFSEDTYRTLTAVDSAVMVLDAAKGIETQTRKLFEVCRLRDMPILTFINKLDREGQDPFALLDEIEQTLQIHVSPASWPIGMGDRFRGCYDLFRDRLLLFEREKSAILAEPIVCQGLEDPEIDRHLPEAAAETLREEVEMVRELCPKFSHEDYLAGLQSPVFFGSALNSFGVTELIQSLKEYAPSPRPQPAAERTIEPTEENTTGFVFKIQANMDPKHRDRIAFVRLCSGHFERGMKLLHSRSGKTMSVHNPVLFLARDRELADEAFPGDILGIPNHGTLHIGDSLSEGERVTFTGIPSFAPELLKRVRPDDPMRAKHLSKALLQLAEEGVAQVFKARLGGDWIVGVAGALQFEVLASRIKSEYNIEATYDASTVNLARWLDAEDARLLKRFIDQNEDRVAEDHIGQPVFLARSAYYLGRAQEDWPDVRFLNTREQVH